MGLPPETPKRRGSALLRAAVAFALGLVVLELGLQAAGALLQGRMRRGAVEADAAALICLGDSNVYGLYEELTDSYPGALARIAGERASDAPTVRNLGWPGKTSYDCVLELRSVLESSAPRAVLVTAGFNNRWSWLPLDEVRYEDPPWYESLRTVRLARLTLSQREAKAAPSAEPIERAQGSRTLHTRKETTHETRDLLGSARRDWREMQRLCEAAGVPFLLVTYGAPRGDYGSLNDAMRRAAEEDGLDVIDVEATCGALATRLGDGEVYYPDYHPRRPGYEVIAREVFNGLVARGVLAGEPIRDVSADIVAAAQAGSIHLRAPSPEAGSAALVVEDEVPGSALQVVLWAPHEIGAPAPDARWPEVMDDPLLQRTLMWNSLRTSVDDHGRAEVRLSLAQLDQADLRGKRVFFGYIVTASGTTSARRFGAEGVGVLP
ncbi:MAG: SGNH/GDSL hydrolase family protein [Planctomycetota bacterium]